MDNYYMAALHASLGYATNRTLKLVEHFGSAEKAFKAGFREAYSQGLISDALLKYAEVNWRPEYPERLYDFCTKNNVRVIINHYSNYPALLREISSPPPVLYVLGTMPVNKVSVAIVGSRQASPYGLKVSREFSEALAARGIAIISGGALGIDAAAHSGALAAEGTTAVILGSGINKFYPRQNAKIFHEIISRGGAVISEFAPGTEALARNFPRRNRIIVGMSNLVFVVEAAEKSGAMITAEMALKEGREICCVPGSIYSATSQGTNSLIRDGAQLVTCPEDVLGLLGTKVATKKEATPLQVDLFSSLPADEAVAASKVLSAIPLDRTVTLEEIVLEAGLPVYEVSNIILNLEIGGLVRENPAQHFIRS